jgi:hypothetical protein
MGGIRTRAARYLTGWAAWTVAWIALAVGFNLLVDPYRLLDLAEFPGVNARRPQMGFHERMVKPYEVARAQPQTLLLGNSRMEIGFDPRDPAIAALPGPVYNLGVQLASLREQRAMLRHALATAPVRRVFVGIDVIDFLKQPKPRSEPSTARLATPEQPRGWGMRLARLGDLVQSYASLKATSDSVATVLGQGRRGEHRTRDGVDPFDELALVVEAEGSAGVFGLNLGAFEKTHLARTGGLDPAHLAEFADLVRTIADAKLEAVFFIHPYHARVLEKIEAKGLMGAVEAWKRSLLATLAQVAAEQGTPPYPLWDFADLDPVTTEPVPTADKPAAMRWWWEASHYKPAVGARMIASMTGSAPPAERIGIRLTEVTIEVHLAQVRARWQEWTAHGGRCCAEIAGRADQRKPIESHGTPATMTMPMNSATR